MHFACYPFHALAVLRPAPAALADGLVLHLRCLQAVLRPAPDRYALSSAVSVAVAVFVATEALAALVSPGHALIVRDAKVSTKRAHHF